MFLKRLNELVAIVSMPMEDYQRPHLVTGLLDRPLSHFRSVREIRFTNAVFPESSFRNNTDQTPWRYVDQKTNTYKINDTVVFDKAPLACRYKSVERWRTQSKQVKPYSKAFLALAEDEADNGHRKSTLQLLRQWLRKSRGQGDETLSQNTAIKGDLMDLFCGGGDASEAARIAGLSVVIAVNKKECAALTHEHNHKRCMTLRQDVTDFITSGRKGQVIADVCHYSCPCQFWSQLHTVAGRNNDANEAAAFVVEETAKRCGCKIMCFEQTPGLVLRQKHKDHIYVFSQQFTNMRFSVECNMVNLAYTSNAQHRIWIVATCPRQKMPEYVQPTHGPPSSGLRPCVTVRQAIANIPTWASSQRSMLEQANRF